jgi:HlyD family secretion protein
MRTLTKSGLSLAFMLALAACSDEPQSAPAKEALPTLSFATVASRTVGVGTTASGVLVAREEAAVLPELSGYRVLRVLADEGDRVRRGQPMATLDGALLAGETARAQAQLASARIAAERARAEYARVSDLTGQGVIADETIAQRGFEASAARTQVQAAQAALREVEVRRNRLTLRAPVAGIVVERSVRPGDVAGTGSEPPFRIARDGRFELEAEVPERMFPQLRVGTPAAVTLASGERLRGTIRLLGQRVDPATRLGRIRILLPLDPSLRLGGFATASLGETGIPVRTVPERALSYEGGPAVLTIDPRGRVARVPVRTGARGNGVVELLDGPSIGTRVLLGGGALAMPGDVVNAVRARP